MAQLLPKYFVYQTNEKVNLLFRENGQKELFAILFSWRYIQRYFCKKVEQIMCVIEREREREIVLLCESLIDRTVLKERGREREIEREIHR